MQMKYRIFITLLSLTSIFFISCKKASDKNPLQRQTTLGKEFLDFYEKFGKDSLFQLEHTVFPLEGIKAPSDESDTPNPEFRWSQKSWIFQKEFDDINGTFQREFYDLNGIIVEKISDKSGTFTMERRFGKLSSGWHLIYYREMGMYGK